MKKYICLIISVFIFLNSAVCFAGIDNKDAVSYLDFDMLKNIGVFDGTDITPDKDAVTRGEFALCVFNMFKLAPQAADKPFIDVDELHFAFDAVNTLSYLGYVSGVSEEFFAPESYISVNEAVKILVSALGYAEYANRSGGYPAGYAAAAARLGIARNISDGTFSAAVLTSLLTDTLDACPLSEAKIKDGVIIYEDDDKKSLGYLNFDLYKSEGFVTGVEPKEEFAREYDAAVIDGNTYFIKNTNAFDYVGRYVEFWYCKGEKDAVGTVAGICDSPDAKVVNIDSEDVLSFDDNTYRYDEDGRETKASVSPSADIFYNGKKVLYSEKFMQPENGSVTLVRYKGGSAYNSVVVWEYKNAYVNSTDADENVVLFKDSTDYKIVENGAVSDKSMLSLGIKDTDFYLRLFDKNGSEKSINALREGNIASVFFDPYGKGAVVYFSGISVTGKVESKDSTKKEIYINGKAYKYKTENLSENDTNAGAAHKFLLDYKGFIVYADQSSSGSENFAFVTDINYVEGAKGKSFMTLTDLGTKTSFEVELKEKIKVDAAKYEIKEEADLEKVLSLTRQGFRTSTTNSFTAPGLVRYKLDGEGKLSEIHTAASPEYPDTVRINTYDDKLNKLLVNTTLGTVGDRALFGDSTIFVDIPYAASENDSYLNGCENLINFMTKSMMASNAQIGAYFDIYYINDSDIAFCFVKHGKLLNEKSSGDINMPRGMFTDFGMFSKKGTASDADGNIYDTVTLVTSSGAEKKYTVAPGYSLSDNGGYSLKTQSLDEGDVFAYYVDGDYIGNFIKMYDVSEGEPMSAFLGAPLAYVNMTDANTRYQTIDAESATSGRYNTTYRATVGRIYSLSSSVVKLALGDTLDNSNPAQFYINSDSIVVYNKKSGNKSTVSKGNISDLKDIEHYGNDASKAVVCIKSGRTVSVFAFNN